jgi:hypothetical protein
MYEVSHLVLRGHLCRESPLESESCYFTLKGNTEEFVLSLTLMRVQKGQDVYLSLWPLTLPIFRRKGPREQITAAITFFYAPNVNTLPKVCIGVDVLSQACPSSNISIGSLPISAALNSKVQGAASLRNVLFLSLCMFRILDPAWLLEASRIYIGFVPDTYQS